MFSRLPLAALRTFEAAARLASFREAAAELNVTATAVSHQVRLLEEHLGTLLFERQGRRVRLNAAGEELQRCLHGAFLEMRRGVEALRPRQDVDSLTVQVTPAFAALWLVPRLGRLYRAHPHIRLRIETSLQGEPLRDASLDLAICCSEEVSSGLLSFPLMEERFMAYGSLRLLEDLRHDSLELIGVDWNASEAPALPSWEQWCEALDEPWAWQAVRRNYPDEHYAVQAALSGQGLVLASSVLASDWVAGGLLRPYREDIALPASRYLAVCVPGRERHPAVRACLDWLHEEAGKAP